MDPAKTRVAQQEAREMFFEDPSLSIDSVAAALDKKHIGLRRDELSRIRLEVRQKVSAGGNDPKSPVLAVSPETARKIQPFVRRHGIPPPPPTPMPSITVKTARPSEPFNPPHIEAPKVVVNDVNVASTPVASQDTKQEVPVAKPATQEERFKWLQDWLLENVDTASTGKARDAMLKHFGPGLAFGSNIISALVKTTREAAGLKPRVSMRAKAAEAAKAPAPRPQPAAPPPALSSKVNVTPIRKGPPTMTEAAATIAKLMREAGLQRVTLDGNEIKVLRAQPQEFAFKVEPL